jgi:hypothetical protein
MATLRSSPATDENGPGDRVFLSRTWRSPSEHFWHRVLVTVEIATALGLALLIATPFGRRTGRQPGP